MVNSDLQCVPVFGLEEAKRRIAACKAANATSLDLNKLGLRELSRELLEAIAEHLPELKSLNLSNNRIGDEGAKAIAATVSPQLTSLYLDDNSIGAEGAKAIAEHLPQLTSLDLGRNSIGDEGAKAIAANCAS